MESIVLTSGYFNPIHIGHIKYLKEAKKLGDMLIVIVNNDEQVKLKGRIPFMNEKERMEIISSLKFVDKVVLSIDKDLSVCQTIKKIRKKYPKKTMIFANGGDRTKKNIPEKEICEKLGIKMKFGVGGKKIQSSSKLIENAISKYLGELYNPDNFLKNE